MTPFKTLKSIPAAMRIINIDTDMIIPKQFLRTIKRTGQASGLFYEMRFDEVTARYGEFGPFYVNLRMTPALLWEHLGL